MVLRMPSLRRVLMTRRSPHDFLRHSVSRGQFWTINRLAFRGGGAFRTGRHVKSAIAGRTTGDLFLTILSAFGIEKQTFGDFGTSPLGGLS